MRARVTVYGWRGNYPQLPALPAKPQWTGRRSSALARPPPLLFGVRVGIALEPQLADDAAGLLFEPAAEPYLRALVVLRPVGDFGQRLARVVGPLAGARRGAVEDAAGG